MEMKEIPRLAINKNQEEVSIGIVKASKRKVCLQTIVCINETERS